MRTMLQTESGWVWGYDWKTNLVVVENQFSGDHIQMSLDLAEVLASFIFHEARRRQKRSYVDVRQLSYLGEPCADTPE